MMTIAAKTRMPKVRRILPIIGGWSSVSASSEVTLDGVSGSSIGDTGDVGGVGVADGP